LWLGSQLPAGLGRTLITVQLSETKDEGLFWENDHPDRKFHKVWLTTSPDRVSGASLAHEVTHCVLATRYRMSLPAWCHEGCASQADGPDRTAQRRDILQWYARTKNWPDLAKVLDAETITPNEQAVYASAAALVEFLLAQNDRATLLTFAHEGAKIGWDRALQTHYQISSVGGLETAWQQWLAENYR